MNGAGRGIFGWWRRMGEVINLRRAHSASVDRTTLQVSRYPQDDGSALYMLEILYRDGTWDSLGHSRDLATIWKMAGKEAGDRRVPLLPESIWPNRSHKVDIG
jgi:hypothetical protein